MRNGLPVDTDLTERIAFISSNTVVWSASWCVWMLSAVGLLIFCVILADEVQQDFRRTVGLSLVALGVLPDLCAQVIYALIIPKFVTNVSYHETVLILELIAMNLTGFLGNMLYNLGGMLLTLLVIKNGGVKRWVSAWGIVAWSLGIFLSISIAMSNMMAAEYLTASSMVSSTLWMLIVAYQVIRPKWNTQY
ncbi:hypothetical protein [Vibrio coralliilyticus]|uniref:hypothetical protein n=1 Tax=Vibrio coralliilyticus TaxID=190893 RepID=UPI001C27374D|nr:hypothetical protein [Vibrio coralliilyticus]